MINKLMLNELEKREKKRLYGIEYRKNNKEKRTKYSKIYMQKLRKNRLEERLNQQRENPVVIKVHKSKGYLKTLIWIY